MKQGMKKIFIILLTLILVIGIFNCMQRILIRNIFDEMYFGTKEIWGGYLTSSSWRNMSGLEKTVDSIKYAVPKIICISFDARELLDDEHLQILWRTETKQLQLIYSVSFGESNHAVSAALDIYYSPCEKRLKVHPLRIVSYKNIYGDTSREAIDVFFEKYGATEAAYYERFREVFETLLINNWRTGNPNSWFQDTLGEFEIVYGTGET